MAAPGTRTANSRRSSPRLPSDRERRSGADPLTPSEITSLDADVAAHRTTQQNVTLCDQPLDTYRDVCARGCSTHRSPVPSGLKSVRLPSLCAPRSVEDEQQLHGVAS